MEKEECSKNGETPVLDDFTLLNDEKIKYHFDNIVIPTMMNALSETANLMQEKDRTTGKTPLEQLDEMTQFFDDADKIVQWVKHGSGQYYIREDKESNAFKRFIEMLEPQTGMISHNTRLDDSSIFSKIIESEFGNSAVKFFKNSVGADQIPFWLTLRLFIKMIDAVEGEDWKNLEESMGSYKFDIIFNLFKKLKSDELYNTCVENFFTQLYYSIFMLFNSWIIFTEMAFEQQVISDDALSTLNPQIKKEQNGIELSFVMTNSNFDHTRSQATFDGEYPMAKRQLLQIIDSTKINYYFSFNYTQTLERIYNVQENDICHIHGVSRGIKNLNDLVSEDLVFGHGLESYDTNVTDIVRTAYNILKKPVNQCIIKSRMFFEKINDVDNIYSYGFSFGDVDMPYIEKICQSIRDTSNVTWYFNDFRIENNRMLYERTIRQSGFKGEFGEFHVD
jgi:hypothetical protein